MTLTRGVTMKKFLWTAGLVVCCSLVLSCSTDPVTSARSSDEITESIYDVLRSNAAFSFSTLNTVAVRVSLQSEEGSVQGALITVRDSEGEAVSYAYSDSEGLAAFNLTTSGQDQDISLVISHAAYPDYTSTVSGLSGYAVIDRRLAYPAGRMPDGDGDIIQDTDGDGVADEEDEFPDDPRFAKAIRGEYTLAFEDLYPVKGDADFNDAATLLQLEERIDGDNRLAQVIITAQALASGAGYQNQLYINVLGQEYPLILNYKQDLSNKANSHNTPEDLVYQPSTLYRVQVIDCQPAVERTLIQPMPYDPFLVPDGYTAQRTDTNGVRYEVHLPSVQTAYSGRLLDEDGFPWAMIVPGDWLWPLERVNITNAYPRFQNWYMTYGESDSDWYLSPQAGQVYPR